MDNGLPGFLSWNPRPFSLTFLGLFGEVPTPGVQEASEYPRVTERTVSVDSSSGVVVTEVDGTGCPFFGVVDHVLYYWILHPVFNEVAEGRDVDGSSCCAWCGDEWLSGSSVGTNWFFAFAPSPVA